MKGITPIAVLLVALVSVGRGQQTERICRQSGQMCSNCSTVAVCLDTGDGRFQTLQQPCRENERCVLGACVPGALCNYRPFACADGGYFPDPYDCTSYHVCLPAGVGYSLMTFSCPVGSSYNSSSQDCSSTLDALACINQPVTGCSNRLEMGTVSGDNGMYYICSEEEDTLAPELRRCPAGRQFDLEALACVDPSSSSSKKDKKKKKSKSS